MNRILLIALLAMTSLCSAQKIPVDLLIYNATVYTVDDKFSVKQALAVKDGKIVATGTTAAIKTKYNATEEMDARRFFIYPGFIDAHAHFLGYGLGLQAVDLTGTTSWEQIVDSVKSYGITHPYGWIIGRGWDQNDWNVKDFPTNEKLTDLFPGRPVFLTRVDGHAAIANLKALENIRPDVKVSGGEVGVKDGQLTGLLVDNAVSLVANKIPAPTVRQKKEALLNAQANCFSVGLTTVDDCGLPFEMVDIIDEMQKSTLLKMRLYVMLSDNENNYEQLFKRGKIKTDRLNVRSFKVYADGALGSRGACLLAPYADKPESTGFLLNTKEHYDEVAAKIFEHGFQMCTHAIGDSANRVILKIYAKYLKGKNDRRWRIEHAQIVNKNDLALFGKYNIVPSVQPTHATSDMYWATDRLGKERVKEAYAYNLLLKQNAWIPLGTDFPVEDISPIKTFYAAVVRKDAKGWPKGGFQMINSLTRKDALRGMTIWAAKANFEEQEKGSLEIGKFADFVILDTDILNVSAAKLLQAKVLQTYVNGEKVYDWK
ncbi:amidohydrolase [soil metagenome]